MTHEDECGELRPAGRGLTLAYSRFHSPRVALSSALGSITPVHNLSCKNPMTMATSTAAKKGVAGRIDYDSWEKRASNLSKELDEEDEKEKEAAASALGLDGKHARSQAEAEEKAKAEEMQKAN